jgi:hypothetical protein
MLVLILFLELNFQTTEPTITYPQEIKIIIRVFFYNQENFPAPLKKTITHFLCYFRACHFSSEAGEAGEAGLRSWLLLEKILLYPT